MNVYAIDKLMAETRRLAAEYHCLTGKVLPVSNELSIYDVSKNLNFITPPKPETGIDLIGTGTWANLKIQVKSRVIFNTTKTRPRVGQLNLESKWDAIILVLMYANYEPHEMYLLHRATLFKTTDVNQAKQNKRGMLSVAKFKALGELIWKEKGE